MIILLIIIGIIVCLGFGGWCGKLGCQSCEEEVKVLRRKLYEAEEKIEGLFENLNNPSMELKLDLSKEQMIILRKILGIEIEEDKEA